MARFLPFLLLALLVPAPAGAELALLTSRRISAQMADLQEYDLYLLRPGKPDLQLTGWEGPEGEPVWCPSRATVIFTAWRGERWQLHEVGLDGAPARLLAGDLPGQQGKPTVSPDGRVVAFPYLAPGSARWELATLELASGELRTRLAFPDGNVVQPEWSPAGDRIAFVTDRAGSLDVGLFELASDRVEWVTEAPTSDREPDFSPDGRQLVYTARKGGSSDLFLYDLGARTYTLLTRLGAFTREASFEPDGRGVVFVSHFEGPNEVYRLGLVDGAITRLTRDPASDSNPRMIAVR